MRWALVATLVACVSCEQADETKADEQRKADERKAACAEAYAAYERTWRAYWNDQFAAFENARRDATPTSNVGDLIADRSNKTLPTRRELAQIRENDAIGSGGEAKVSQIARDAYAAAERAIALCGDGAARPP